MPLIETTTTVEPLYMIARANRTWPFVSRHQLLPNTMPSVITGELYEIEEALLTRIDAFEYRYVRTPIQTSCGKLAYMYLLEDIRMLETTGICEMFVPVPNGDYISQM